MTSGSLGLGISAACGMALAGKINKKDYRVYAILGDGECEEGQVWEAAMFSAHRKLDNLTAIIDHNGLQIDGKVTEVCSPEDLGMKFEAFGWDVHHVNGHDIDALTEVLNACKSSRDGKPHAVIAETVKGKGVSFMENEAGWHGKAPSAEQLEAALAELEAACDEEVCRG